MNEEQLQELETLRREKQAREQAQRAQAALAQAKVPQSFAPLLAGEDDAATDRRCAEFCAAYQSALSEDIRARLPEQPPVTTPAAPPRPKRGIQCLR